MLILSSHNTYPLTQPPSPLVAAFSILEFALFFLTPFFAIFLTSVGNLCKKIEDDEDVEMGPAVVDTVMDAADGVLAEFQGLVSSGYAAVLTLTTVVFLVINHIF